MQKVEIKVVKLPHFDQDFGMPFYASEGAAGADIRASFPDKISRRVMPGERMLIPTGLQVEIPMGFELQVRPRSGLSLKSSLLVVNSPGTIDSDYRGEIQIIIGNFGSEDYVIEHGLRLAQLVVAPVLQAIYFEAESLSQTIRGQEGFGSTGVR
jgi:dUTP pyrophosphatase